MSIVFFQRFGLLVAAMSCLPVFAAPVTYTIDSDHTYPSFTVDHMGISKWRGKFNHTKGQVILDRAAKTGSVDIDIDPASINFGHAKMEAHAKGPDMFDVEKFPKIIYKGQFSKFNGAVPTAVRGELSLHGVTKPVDLTVHDFRCKTHFLLKKEVCGADVEGKFDRDAFGIDYGKKLGFNQEVVLHIQVEGLRAE